MNCPNHPAGRTCPACDPPSTPVTVGWVLKFLALWIPAMLLFFICPVTIFFWIGILVVHAVIKSAMVAAAKEIRKL